MENITKSKFSYRDPFYIFFFRHDKGKLVLGYFHLLQYGGERRCGKSHRTLIKNESPSLLSLYYLNIGTYI